MNKKLLSLIFLFAGFLIQTDSYGSHQMAAELTYQQIAQNTFVVNLTFFRDCSGIAEDPTYPLKITSPGCNAGRTITLNKSGSTAGTIGTPFCSAALNTCTTNSGNYQKFTYSAVFIFTSAEMNCQDWTLSTSFNNGNRPTVANVLGNPYMYIETQLRFNILSNFSNNSAIFNALSPVVPIVNQNQPVSFSTLAYDPDGDSLAYFLVPALNAAYAPVTYSTGYSSTSPIQSNPAISINHSDGQISFVAPAYSAISPDQNKYIKGIS